MSLDTYFDYWKKILALIPFNVFDYLTFFILLIYVFEDASFGLLPAAIGFASTVLAFFVGLLLYHPLSQILSNQLSLAKGIADAISFFIVTLLSFTLISAILTIVRKKYVTLTFPKKINVLGGVIFGSLSFFFIASFAVALLLSFPISNTIKYTIKDSVTGRLLTSQTQLFEGHIRQVFGGAIDETINFLTIKPDSNESVNLNFKIESFKEDPKSEGAMLSAVNLERATRGLPSLSADESLRNVAQAHAKDMLKRGYFSHYTPEGNSPFDRMAGANISYQYAGENLAFAPDVKIAMDGLMKSPGHAANILSKNFGKVGIGVIDAGIYGEMFVQEFTD